MSQVSSGREGINISSADALIFYNIDFAAVSFLQSRARIQNFTRDRVAEVHWTFVRGGIEKKVYDVVSNKMDFTYRYFMNKVAHNIY